MYLFVCACTCVYIYTHMHLLMQAYTYVMFGQMMCKTFCMCIYIYLSIYIYLYMHVYGSVCVCAYIRIYIYVTGIYVRVWQKKGPGLLVACSGCCLDVHYIYAMLHLQSAQRGLEANMLMWLVCIYIYTCIIPCELLLGARHTFRVLAPWTVMAASSTDVPTDPGHKLDPEDNLAAFALVEAAWCASSCVRRMTKPAAHGGYIP